jgi:WD40 repeat protein
MNIKNSSQTLDAIARDFISDDLNLLPKVRARVEKATLVRKRTRITLAIAVILIFGIVVLISTPEGVRAMKRLLGYIPGVGLVEQISPIRILKEPISEIRDGVTVSVTQLIVTNEKTQIHYQIFGVPRSAYPENETLIGCVEPAYLRLPDMTRIYISDQTLPIPPDVNEVVFVLPCIWNTLPGSVPGNWELPLQIMTAPVDIPTMPVIDMTPAMTQAARQGTDPGIRQDVVFEQVIKTENGYILIGGFLPQVSHGVWVQITDTPSIIDANGAKILYRQVSDIELPSYNSPSSFGFAYQVDSTEIVFPLTISFSGVYVFPTISDEKAEVEFDTGPNPRVGQEWILNKEVQISEHKLRLISVTADTQNSYSFHFEADEMVDRVGITILGHTPLGSGGGGGIGSGHFSTSLSFPNLPTGNLKIIFFNLTLVSSNQVWQGSWQPSASHTTAIPTQSSAEPVCLAKQSMPKLEPLPSNINGKVIIYDTSIDGLVISYLNGQQIQIILEANSGVFSPDGVWLAYSTTTGIKIQNIETGEVSVLTKVVGRDLHWSPDGKYLGFAGSSGNDGVFIVAIDGTNLQKITDTGYEFVAGWSPDSTILYINIPDINGNGWMFSAVDVKTRDVQNLFILEGASRKAPNAAISPNGKWIAYRDIDNSSLYLVRPDGSEKHIIVEKPVDVISSIAWSQDGNWLIISLANLNTKERNVIFIRPENCDIFIADKIYGDFKGIIIP